MYVYIYACTHTHKFLGWMTNEEKAVTIGLSHILGMMKDSVFEDVCFGKKNGTELDFSHDNKQVCRDYSSVYIKFDIILSTLCVTILVLGWENN